MRLFSILIGLLVLTTLATPAQAQRPPGDLGVGVQVGDPVGLTLRHERAGNTALEALAAWDLSDEALFVSGHLVYEHSLRESTNAPVQFFYGPGAYVGAGDGDFSFGVSGRVGVSYFLAPLEFFAQITPRFNLVPDTDFDVGGGLGARYYF